MEFVIKCFLYTITCNALAKISLRVEEADADERQTKIASFFTMIAGKDAQATGVNRKGLIDTELR